MPNEIEELIKERARYYNVPEDIALRMAKVESTFNPKAEGPMTKYGTAKGLFQFIDSTAKGMGLDDPYDPYKNADAAMRMLSENASKLGGRWDLAVAAHQAGLPAVQKNMAIPGGGDVNTPTSEYVRKIMGGEQGVAQMPQSLPSKETTPQQEQPQYKMIEVKGRGTFGFPQSMKDDEILEVLRKKFPSQHGTAASYGLAPAIGALSTVAAIPEAGAIEAYNKQKRIAESTPGIGEGMVGLPIGMTGKPLPTAAAPWLSTESQVYTQEQIDDAKKFISSPISDNSMYKLGQSIRGVINEDRIPNEIKESTTYNVLKVLGQVVPQAGAFAVSPGLAGPASVFIMSGAGEVAEMYKRGKAQGVPDDLAIPAAIEARNLGLWDVAGMTGLFGAIGKVGKLPALKGFVGKVIKTLNKYPRTAAGVLGAAEEAATEIPQTIGEDKLARKYFGESVNTFADAVESGKVAGISGYILGVALASVGIKMRNKAALRKLNETLAKAEKDKVLEPTQLEDAYTQAMEANYQEMVNRTRSTEQVDLDSQYEEALKRVGVTPPERQVQTNKYGLQEEPSPLQQPPAPPSGEGGAPLTSPPIATGEQTQTTGMKTDVLPQAPVQRTEPAVTQQIRANLANRAAKVAGVESEESLGKDYEEWLTHIDSLGEQDYAESLRGDEGQVQEPGSLGQEDKGEGGQDLQQQTPEQAGQPQEAQVKKPYVRPLNIVKKTLQSAKRTVRSVIEWTPPSVEERFAQEDEARRQLDASKRVWAHMLGEASLDIKNDTIGQATARLQELQAKDTSAMSKAQLKAHKAALKETAEELSDAQNSLEWVKESSNEPLSFDWIYDSFGFEDMGFSKEALRNAVLQGKVDTNALMDALESFKRVRTQEQIEAGLEEEDLPGRQVGKTGSTELYSFNPLAAMYNKNLKNWLGNSVITDTVFHGTADRFDRFDPEKKYTGIGFHFGNKRQAINRMKESVSSAIDFSKKPKAKILEGYIRIENPLYMDDALGWDIEGFANEMHKQNLPLSSKAISKIDYYNKLYQSNKLPYEKANKKLEDILKKEGYDGIIYENKVEGEGKSYLVFDSNQFKSIENKGTFSNETDSFLYSFGGMFGRMFHDKLSKGKVFSGKYDQMPRYYISDKGAKLKDDTFNAMKPHGSLGTPGDTLKVGDVMEEGWEVFDNYPDAKDINIKREPKLFDISGASQGWFDHTTNTINITPYAKDPLSTILHEVQHWIQAKEGFAKGGNPESIDTDAIPDSLLMKHARDLHDELRKSFELSQEEVIRRRNLKSFLANVSFEDRKEFDILVDAYNDLRSKKRTFFNRKKILRGLYRLEDQMKNIVPDFYAYEPKNTKNKFDIMRQYNSYELDRAEYEARDLLDSVRVLEDGSQEELATLVKKKKAFELYQHIAGEIEAREVQKMAKMSEEQLKTYEPFSDTPSPEEAITLYSFSLDALTKKRISEEKAALLKGANKDDVVNMLVSENLGFLGRHASQGQWATKDDPAIEPVFRAGMMGKNYFHEGASQSTGTLRNYGRLDSTEKQIVDKVLWNHEGIPYTNQGITETPYIEKNGKLSLNEQFYKQYRKWASSKLNGIDSLVDAVVDIRQGMDQDMVNYWNTIQNNRRIFSSEVLDELNERRSIPNYLPHTRKGDFVVAGYIKNQDGTMTKVVDKSVDLSWIPPFMRNKYFERHLSKRLIAQLKEDPVIKGMGDITWGLENREHIPYQVMNQPKLAKALNEIVEASALNIKDPKLANIIRKVMPASILDAVRSTGMWTHMAKRRGVYGYEMENLGKILFDYKMGMYANLSKMQVSQDLAAALQKIDTRKKNSIQWADQFVTDMMEPRTVSDSVASFVKAAAFMKYLGMGVKPAVVNISSAATHAHPRLATEIGVGRAYGYLGSAMKDFTAYQMGKIKSLSPDEIKLLNELRNDGTTQAQLINEVRRSVARGTATSKYAGAFFDASTFLMRVTEENIRGGLALAAFRAAKDGKIRSKRSLAKYQFEEGKAVDPNDEVKYQYLRDFTEELVNDAFSIFGKVNRPGLLRTGRVGKITSGAYTFRHFMQHTISLAGWMAKQGKLGNKDARGALFMGALSQVMLAGMAGVVGQELWRRLYREWLPEKAKIMGDDPLVWTKEHLGDWAAYGLPSMLGVSVGSSYGIELPGGVEDIVGVPYSLVKDMYYGAKAAKSGDYMRAAEMVVPLKLARDILSAHRKNTQGFTTYSGQPITEPGSQEKMKLTKPEFYRSLFGFQPIRLQRARDVSEIVDSMDSMRQKKMQDVADRYGVAYSKGDTAGMESALDEVVEWNDYWLDKGKFQYLIKPKDAIQSRLKPQRTRKGLRGTEMEIGRKMGF